MRQLTTILLTAGVSGTALGHELPGTDNQLHQLIHLWLSVHHSPAILLVVALCFLVDRALRLLSE